MAVRTTGRPPRARSRFSRAWDRILILGVVATVVVAVTLVLVLLSAGPPKTTTWQMTVTQFNAEMDADGQHFRNFSVLRPGEVVIVRGVLTDIRDWGMWEYISLDGTPLNIAVHLPRGDPPSYNLECSAGESFTMTLHVVTDEYWTGGVWFREYDHTPHYQGVVASAITCN